MPKDESNLPAWPGKPDGKPGDANSHKLENYLDLSQYPETTKKYQLVKESFDKAQAGINKLMEPDSGFYNDVSVRKTCPINNIEIKGPKEVAHHEYATFTVSYTNPKKEAKGIEIMGFDGLTVGAEWIKIPDNKLKSGKFQFRAYNEDFFGSVDADKSFSASLISDPSVFSSYIATSDPVANVNFLGSGSGWSGLPAQAIPVHDKNDNFWIKWLS